ncbi:MAG: GFA family protein [Devosia sp.]|nr:GFA family protein [Devosia sp.]
MSDVHLSGGCQCGAVRFHITGNVGTPSICHCRMCQKAHGAPVIGWLTVPDDKLDWTRGAPAAFRSSAEAVRSFCGHCGTPLAFHRDGAAATDIAIAALDEPERSAPVRQYGIEARMSWFDTAHLLPGEVAGACNSSFQHPDHDTADWVPHHV